MIDIPRFDEMTFDERAHIYKLNGIRLPSVTQIMRPLSQAYYGEIDESILNTAAKRGTDVHQAIENWLKFGFDDAPEEHRGYFDAFRLWMDEQKPDIIATEGRVYHRVLRYAGTADLVCITENDVLTCVDIKTSSQIIEMLVRVQLTAYAKAFESHGLKFDVKQAVHLKRDGGYSVKEFPGRDNEAWDVFCSLLTVENYLKKNGR
jgi:hypothetical protein